jgi:hypothetical protein
VEALAEVGVASVVLRPRVLPTNELEVLLTGLELLLAIDASESPPTGVRSIKLLDGCVGKRFWLGLVSVWPDVWAVALVFGGEPAEALAEPPTLLDVAPRMNSP